jgi:hypothetical protein
MEKRYKKYVVVMVLCFLFGGFSLVSYFLQAYSYIWRTDVIPAIRNESENLNATMIPHDFRRDNVSGLERGQPLADPSAFLLAPYSIVLLFTGIVSLLAGFSIWNLIREREIKFAKKQVLDVFLLPDEKKVLNEIEKYGGSLTQSELVKSTGLSRVKVHRIVKNLENKKLIMKQAYGMTNKIVLKK